MTSGVKQDGQIPTEDLTAEEMVEGGESSHAAAVSDSLETSPAEEPGSKDGIQGSEQVSGVRRKAVVKPVEGASEDLQEPKFIKIGSPTVDEL